MTEHRLNISGMKCDGCVSAVQEALRGVPGVERVDVNLAEKRASVTGEVATEALVQAVKDAGYGATTEEAVEAIAK